MTQMVELVIDEQAMRRNLRYAFANHDTAVQELIQNARRAGASHVEVEYDETTRELIVSDDGCGIEDFAALMRVGGSAWSDDIAQAERPYGMGFLAAIYAAEHVTITSRGQRLAFSTQEAIDRATFAVEAAIPRQGTTVRLRGFGWDKPRFAIERMAQGYPIPIHFGGHALVREDAQGTDGWHQTSVGAICLRRPTCPRDTSTVRVYLQGFIVQNSRGYSADVVVHLDASRFVGKFPDRDVVMDQERMLEEVEREIRALYERRLEDMRAKLDPLLFSRQAYDLAASLHELKVFNDIDVAPSEWFRRFEEAPFDTYEWENYLGDLPEGQAITRAEIESGAVRVCFLDPFDACSGQDALRWFFAWRTGCLSFERGLDADHWLLRHLAVTDHTQIEMTVVQPGTKDVIPSRASISAEVQLCEALELRANDLTVSLDDVAIGIQTERMPLIYVPCTADRIAYPDRTTLKQIDRYLDDSDDPLDEDLDNDVEIVCAKVDAMGMHQPEERLAQALQRALRHYPEVRGLKCTMAVDSTGTVTVTDLSMTDEPGDIVASKGDA